MKRFGLISHKDEEILTTTLNLILRDCKEDTIRTCEVGLFNGETSRGIHDYILGCARFNEHIAIDNKRDFDVQAPFPDAKFIVGNSSEVYNQIPNESQDLIFIDALHTFPAVIADFYCYEQKVKIGGYLIFHDTGKHLDPLSGWQLLGDKGDPDMCLGGVRKALKRLGLYNNKQPYWRLIFDEADPNDTGGGMSVFKRIM